MEGPTVAPAEVYNQEKRRLAQTTHARCMTPWPALQARLTETLLQVKPERHEGAFREKFISTTCHRPLLCWARGPGPWGRAGHASLRDSSPSLWGVSHREQRWVLGQSMKLQFYSFFLCWHGGYFWSVYGEGVWALDNRRQRFAPHQNPSIPCFIKQAKWPSWLRLHS